MCGIVAAVADRNIVPVLLEGLRKLEYRGYDSAGLALINASGLQRLRAGGVLHPRDRLTGSLTDPLAEADRGIRVDRTHQTAQLPLQRGLFLVQLADDAVMVHRSIIAPHQRPGHACSPTALTRSVRTHQCPGSTRIRGTVVN